MSTSLLAVLTPYEAEHFFPEPLLADLRALFEKYGPLSELTIPVDTVTKKSKAFAFVGFVMPEPAHHGRYRERLPVLRYGQTENSVVILNKALFDKSLPTGNPEARQQALALCAREMAIWGDDAARQPLLARAQAEMALTGRGYPGPEELAERLHLSLRTLRRKLAAEGSGYQALLDAARARDALALLAQPELEIRQIARLLGYEDPANFTRAFRSRTGLTPSAARLSHASPPSPAPATTD